MSDIHPIHIIVFYVYMIISCICLIIITHYTVSNNSKTNNTTSNFENRTPYTNADLDADWKALNCSAKLTSSDIRTALGRGNDPRLSEFVARQNAKAFLARRANDKGCVGGQDRVSAKIPSEHMSVLMQIWKDTKCNAPFPTSFIESLYDQGLTFNSVQARFKNYIHDMNMNLLHNDTETELLSTSFKKCYGDNWRDDKSLEERFAFVNSLT